MKVLIAEDDPTSRRILEAMLSKWGYCVVSARDGNEAWNVLQAAEAPSLAVLDRMMPVIDGGEICQRVRLMEKGTDRYTYLILLTVKGAKEDIVSGMEAGADDYVVKPFDEQELRVRTLAGRRIIELQSKLLEAKRHLFQQARIDSLTGILNRGALLSELELEMSRSQREKTALSLIMLDLDHFKKINDSYGHHVGDAVLREFVKRISHILRPYDSFGRIGGEEFMIILPGADSSGVFSVCKRILEIIGKDAMVFKENNLNVTASLGVATVDGKENMEDLLARVDDALYKAKKKGRNCMELAIPDVL